MFRFFQGGLLFGHYGRRSDLLQLKHHGIDVKGHLLLLRLGKISVDEKVWFMGIPFFDLFLNVPTSINKNMY